MSYYRYITGIYKSYWPGLNRTLRSSSVPRNVPDIDCGTYGLNVSGVESGLRSFRSSSMPPTSDSIYSSSSFLSRHSASPFMDRAFSVPPSSLTSSIPSSFSSYSSSRPSAFSSYSRSSVSRVESTHYTDFDCKVLDYMGKLDRDYSIKNEVSQARRIRESSPPRYDYGSRYSDRALRASRERSPDYFGSKYNYYDGNKHKADYLYESSKDVLGNWLVTGKSRDTLNRRNDRATSPLISRGLDRYYGSERRSDYMGDISSGRGDFRHYNYRKTPYFGQSDYMKYIPKYFNYLNDIPGQRYRDLVSDSPMCSAE